MKNIMRIFFLVIIMLTTPKADDSLLNDRFYNLKQQLRDAGCISIEFISVLESSIFDTIDSSKGLAIISNDGRYNILIGSDRYIYDLEKSYSYSQENNQVIIENVSDPESIGKELSFIKNLDDFYVTKKIKKNKIYKLTRIETSDDYSDIPDSMMIYVSNNDHFDSLSFYDINEDINHIYFIYQKLSDTCDNSFFVPSFPDSVERVRF